jgi:hypothetical protein
LRALLGELVRSAVLLGGIGAVSVGVSGLIAWVIRAVAGSRAVVDVTPGQVLSALDCARWTNVRPGVDCSTAAVANWADETVYYRLAVGLLGLLALVAYLWLRRGRPVSQQIATVRDTIGATAFGVAAVVTLGLGVDSAVVGGGAGQWLSATVVALAAAVGFAVLLLRELRTAEPRTGSAG